MARLSRKKRIRYYRQTLAEAIAHSPGSCGGWGNGLDVSRSDLLLIRPAIREGWPVPRPVKDRVMLNIFHVFDTTESPRMMAAVARAVVAMEAHNQRLDLAAQFQPSG